MSNTFPFLTNCISASMIHTTNLSEETKRTGKIYLIQKVSACYYVNSHFSKGNIFEMVKI